MTDASRIYRVLRAALAGDNEALDRMRKERDDDRRALALARREAEQELRLAEQELAAELLAECADHPKPGDPRAWN